MRVLLVRLSALGDIVESLGAAEALARARPELELHFVVQRPFAPLLAHLPWLHAVHAPERSWRGFLAGGRALRRVGFAVALDLQGNWKSAALAAAAGVKARIGPPAHQRREPSSRLLMTRASAPAATCHPAAIALAVVRTLAPAAVALAPRLLATSGELEREAAALHALGVKPDQPFRILVAGSALDPRTWPVAWMQRAAEEPGPPAVFLAGPDERELRLPSPALRHDAGELRRLVALGCLVARSGGVVYGPDRGATHVLAACGAPTLALFGPQDPGRTAPTGATVLQRSDPPSCMPCCRRTCDHREGPVCMAFSPGRPAGTASPESGVLSSVRTADA